MINSLFTFKTKEGSAAVVLDLVYAILPDLKKGKCLVISPVFPDGMVTAEHTASELIGAWSEMLEENEEESEIEYEIEFDDGEDE